MYYTARMNARMNTERMNARANEVKVVEIILRAHGIHFKIVLMSSPFQLIRDQYLHNCSI